MQDLCGALCRLFSLIFPVEIHIAQHRLLLVDHAVFEAVKFLFFEELVKESSFFVCHAINDCSRLAEVVMVAVAWTHVFSADA